MQNPFDNSLSEFMSYSGLADRFSTLFRISTPKMLRGRPIGEFKTLVFFDLETTGLFEGPDQQDPRVPSRSIPGDLNRDVEQMFRTYADIFDNSNDYRLPRMTEISLIAVPRRIYKEGVTRLYKNFIGSTKQKSDLKVNLPSRVLVQQINPELSEPEWKVYEQKQRSLAGFHLQKSDLTCQLTFRESWPLIHAFLASLEPPAVLIAHNGLRFDCRVLLGELRRTNLLQTHPLPPSVHFLDSYLAFLDLEKRFHEEVQMVMSCINWKLITQAVMRKRPSIEFNQRDLTVKRPRHSIANPDGDRQAVITVTSTDSDETFDAPESVLKRLPHYDDRDSPPRDNQNCPNEGWRTAPAKLAEKNEVEDFTLANPMNFMKVETWSPAKRRRLRDEFFERKDDGDWAFSVPMAKNYFNARGNFRLVRLYTDIINGLYAEHHAYDDCVALMNVCLAYGNDFLDYVDRYSAMLDPLSSHT